MKKIILIMLIMVFLLITACGTNNNEPAVLYRRGLDEREAYIIGNIDSERLRELLDKNAGWEKGKLTDADAGLLCWLEMDGVNYEFYYRDSHARDFVQIRRGKIGSDANDVIINRNEKTVSEMNDIISKWFMMQCSSYESLLEEYQKKENQAIVYLRSSEENKHIMSVEDTNRLRELITIEQGWYQYLPCNCIGDYKLILDNVCYIVDLDDVSHQMKFSEVDGNAKSGLQNDNLEIVEEVYEIIGKYF